MQFSKFVPNHYAMNKQILLLEKEMDSIFDSLKIWDLPFQAVLSNLLFLADIVDSPDKKDNPFDFASRLSYILPQLKKRCNNLTLCNTSLEALRLAESEEYLKDLSFLNSYAHLSMITPQVHRNTFITREVQNNLIKLEFEDKLTENAELIDRLYSNLACEVIIPFDRLDELGKLIRYEYENDIILGEEEYKWVIQIYKYYLRAQVSIKVLPDNVLIENLGFSHEELYKFCAAFRAFADLILVQGNTYKDLSMNESLSIEEREYLGQAYVNCMVYQMADRDLELIQDVSGLKEEILYKILSYYTTIISNDTGKEIQNISSCGDGYFPPLTLISKVFITSPHAIRCLLNVNNLLYSLNITQKRIFDNHISGELEPILIKQIRRVFDGIPGLRSAPNVNYGSDNSEIDILVLSEESGVCISIQAKATLAPDSARTVARVEGRVTEGVTQTQRFEKLSEDEKLQIINRTFNTNIQELKIIHLIVVRSSAGSKKSWNYNEEYRIINYPVLAKILADKIISQNLSIEYLPEEILEFQQNLIDSSECSFEIETLEINNTMIQFPIIDFNIEKLLLTNFTTLKVFPDFLDN